MTIAQRVELVMKKAGVSRYRIAKELGVHQSTVKSWFETEKFSFGDLQRMANVIGVPLDKLLFDDDAHFEEVLERMRQTGKIDLSSSSERDATNKQTDINTNLMSQETPMDRIEKALYMLNDKGKEEAANRVEELAEISKYTE